MWKNVIEALRNHEPFKTACGMWAAGEKAIDEDRCWPPTWIDGEKLPAPTSDVNEAKVSALRESAGFDMD